MISGEGENRPKIEIVQKVVGVKLGQVIA